MFGAAAIFFCPANTGADHNTKFPLCQRQALYGAKTTSCARKLSTPFLQAPAGKRVGTSLLGDSSFVALCSLAFPQEGTRGRELFMDNTK